MSDKKQVILVHGIGDAGPDFYKSWEKILVGNHGSERFEVKGFCWEPLLEKVERKYPIASGALADALAPL